MLVLTRKQGEVIQIGDSITITVLRMKGKSVRIGIKAPKDFNVIRGELAFEVAEEQVSDESEEPVTATSATAKTKRIAKDADHYRDGGTWSTNASHTTESTIKAAEAWSI